MRRLNSRLIHSLDTSFHCPFVALTAVPLSARGCERKCQTDIKLSCRAILAHNVNTVTVIGYEYILSTPSLVMSVFSIVNLWPWPHVWCLFLPLWESQVVVPRCKVTVALFLWPYCVVICKTQGLHCYWVCSKMRVLIFLHVCVLGNFTNVRVVSPPSTSRLTMATLTWPRSCWTEELLSTSWLGWVCSALCCLEGALQHLRKIHEGV